MVGDQSLRQQQVDQQPMREVIRLEMALDAIARQRVGDRHDGGIPDEAIDLVAGGEGFLDLGSGLAHRRDRVEVDVHPLDLGLGRDTLDVGDRALGVGARAAQEHQAHWMAGGERKDGLGA